MRVIVTGAAGFIGAATVRALLEAGHEVIALARERTSLWRIEELLTSIQLLRVDLADTEAIRSILRQTQPVRCIHLAWYARPADYLQSEQNAVSEAQTVALVRQMIEAGCEHVTIAGSCAEYDLTTGRTLDERSATRPATPYGAAKLSANQATARLAAGGSIGVAWARLFYVLGPRENRERIVPAVINACLDGVPIAVSAGGQVRDFLHVDDVASAFCALTTAAPDGTFNVCSGKPVALSEVFDAVERLTGVRDMIRRGARAYAPDDPMFVCGDHSRLQAATSWVPQHDFPDAIADSVEWWSHDRERA